MIRVVSAWALIVLAVSPVTAPFESCDLGALFTLAPGADLMMRTIPVSRPISIHDNANSVPLPLVQREPTAESRAGNAILPFRGVSTAIRGVDTAPQIRRSPRDRSTRLTVLRV